MYAFILFLVLQASQYQQRYQELVRTYEQKRRCLVNPSQEMRDVFLRVYNKEEGVALTPTLYNSPTQSGGVFGGSTTTASTAGSSIFGGGAQKTTSSIFGGNISAHGSFKTIYFAI